MHCKVGHKPGNTWIFYAFFPERTLESTGVTFYSEVKLKNFSLQVWCPVHRYLLLVQLLCFILLVFGNLHYNWSKEQSSLKVYQWLPLWHSPMNIYIDILILRTWGSNTFCEVCIFCFPGKEVSFLAARRNGKLSPITCGILGWCDVCWSNLQCSPPLAWPKPLELLYSMSYMFLLGWSAWVLPNGDCTTPVLESN